MPFIDFTNTATPEFKNQLTTDSNNYHKWTLASTVTKYSYPTLIALINVVGIVLDNVSSTNKTITDNTITGVNLAVTAAAATLIGVFQYLSNANENAVKQDVTLGIKNGYLPKDFSMTDANFTMFPTLRQQAAETKEGDLNTVEKAAADALTYRALTQL